MTGRRPAPRVVAHGAGHTLLVDDRPFLVVGGELHNSTSSHRTSFEPALQRLGRTGVNTVIASVAWSEVEPEEDHVDLRVVDELLAAARQAGLRLVLIWFGAFKNAASTYAPRWVRADRARFPRAVVDDGRPTRTSALPERPVLTVFNPELVRVEERAHAALGAHLAAVDHERTVLMVQVENEVGLLGAARDRSPGALAAWAAPVPQALADLAVREPAALPAPVATALATSPEGSWADLFDEEDATAGEVFSAWAFATHVEAVATAGAAHHGLPTFANAWLGPQPGQPAPGDYPSGGPTQGVLGVWRAAAPGLALLAPDVYVPDARPVLAAYAAGGFPLFVPEARFRAGDLFLAVADHGALGHCPFRVEDVAEHAHYLRAARAVLASADVLLAARARGEVFGFALEHAEDSAEHDFGDLVVTVRDADTVAERVRLDAGLESARRAPSPPAASETLAGTVPEPPDPRPCGLVARTAPGEFLVVGCGADVTFTGTTTEVEVDAVRELRLHEGRWRSARHLNGDERMRLLPADTVGAVRVSLLGPDVRTDHPPVHAAVDGSEHDGRGRG